MRNAASEWESRNQALRIAIPNESCIRVLLIVLAFTEPEREAFDRSLPPLAIEPPPSPPRRTARNPRGFQGTLRQPPAPAQSKPQDWWPHLDGGTLQARLLRQLGSRAQNILDFWCSHPDDPAVPPAPPEGWASLRDRLGLGGPAVSTPDMPVPERLRRYLGQGSYPPAADEWIKFGQWYWTLDLDRNPDFIKAWASLRARQGRMTNAWLASVVSIQPPRRRAWVGELLTSGVPEASPATATDFASRVDSLSADDSFAQHAKDGLMAWHAGHNPEAYLTGLALALDFYPNQTSDIKNHVGTPAQAELREVQAILARGQDDWASGGYILTLWQTAGVMPKLVTHVFPLLAQRDQDAGLVFEFLKLFTDTLFLDDPPTLLKLKQKWLCDHAGDLFRLIQSVPEPYRSKATLLSDEFITYPDTEEEFFEWWPRLLRFVPQVCCEPHPEGILNGVFRSLAYSSSEEWLALPQATWQKVASACKRGNDVERIRKGLLALAQGAPEWIGPGLGTANKAALSAAKTLGSLSEAHARTLVRKLSQEPLLADNWDRWSLRQIVESLDLMELPAAKAKVPARLRAHFQGKEKLSEARLDAIRKDLVASRPTLVFARIEQVTIEQLSQGLSLPRPPKTSGERHALLIHLGTDEHRRSLRRLIKEYFAGGADRRSQHPRNRQWVVEHLGARIHTWRAGIVFERETEPWGNVQIQFESNWLEALRLGTYVGSCLGLGGGHTYSAAAIVLDANKQVAYAKDPNGKVLGRQVVALSNRPQLHCYEIYSPEDADKLEPLFLEFDRALAKAMDLKIYQPDEDASDSESKRNAIESLLSRGWWDDGAIEVSPDTEPADGP